MASGYYVDGAERAEKVRSLFGRIAPRYDLINDLQSFGLHRFWKNRLVRAARIQPGERVLDICTGTGDLALRFAECGAQATGCDFTAAMLDQARQRPEAGRVEFVQADALNLPFADATFDAASMGYGLRNLADLDRGLAEMCRVVKPGGRLLILDFGKPANPLWRALYFAYLRFVVPIFGRLLCGDAAAYSYILESLRAYPGQEPVAARLRALGCGRVEVDNLLGGIMAIHRAVRTGRGV